MAKGRSRHLTWIIPLLVFVGFFAVVARIETHYGMGVFSWTDFPCKAWVGHEGASPGYDIFSYSRRDGRRQVTVQINSLNAQDKAGDEMAQKAWLDLVRGAACK